MDNYIFKLFESLEFYTHPTKITKFKKYYYILAIPYFFCLELFVRYKIWKKLIIPELITNDIIIEFLDKNEFAYKNGILHKMDLLETNEYYDRMSLDESKEVVKVEFIKTFLELFRNNVQIDVEDWVNILVTTDYKYVTDKENKLVKSKIYEVKLQYCREFFFLRAKSLFYKWLLTLILITIPIIYFYYHLIIKTI